VRYSLQQLIALEVAAVLGTGRHELTDDRRGYCNSSRPLQLTTQIPLSVAKLCSRSGFPLLLES